MAKSADHVLAEFQADGLALIAADEGGDAGEGESFEAIDSARQDLQEALADLRSMVFEFRKRANRIPRSNLSPFKVSRYFEVADWQVLAPPLAAN